MSDLVKMKVNAFILVLVPIISFGQKSSVDTDWK